MIGRRVRAAASSHDATRYEIRNKMRSENVSSCQLNPSTARIRVGSITSELYLNYKIQITFVENNSNTILNYFGYGAQNTKYTCRK